MGAVKSLPTTSEAHNQPFLPPSSLIKERMGGCPPLPWIVLLPQGQGQVNICKKDLLSIFLDHIIYVTNSPPHFFFLGGPFKQSNTFFPWNDVNRTVKTSFLQDYTFRVAYTMWNCDRNNCVKIATFRWYVVFTAVYFNVKLMLHLSHYLCKITK